MVPLVIMEQMAVLHQLHIIVQQLQVEEEVEVQEVHLGQQQLEGVVHLAAGE